MSMSQRKTAQQYLTNIWGCERLEVVEIPTNFWQNNAQIDMWINKRTTEIMSITDYRAWLCTSIFSFAYCRHRHASASPLVFVPRSVLLITTNLFLVPPNLIGILVVLSKSTTCPRKFPYEYYASEFIPILIFFLLATHEIYLFQENQEGLHPYWAFIGMIISEFDFCNTHSSPRMYVQHMYDLLFCWLLYFTLHRMAKMMRNDFVI